MEPRRGAFSLIELLVVVSIIALLLAMLTPAMKRVRDLARQSSCAVNLRMVGVGTLAYAGDHAQRYIWHGGPFADYLSQAGGKPWDIRPALLGYVGDARSIYCPASGAAAESPSAASTPSTPTPSTGGPPTH